MEVLKRFALMAAVAMSIASMSAGFAGCNTVEGAGEDIERGGERIQDAADNDE